MKLSRSLLIGAASVAVLLVLVVALAFTPAVQTWATRKFLQQQPGMRADVERVAVGMNSVRVRDLRLLQPGLGVVLPSVEIDLPVLAAARERVAIKRLVAKGWTVDLTVTGEPGANLAANRQPQLRSTPESSLVANANAQTVPGAVPSAVFNGLFESLKLPVDLEIESAELEGDVIFPTAPGQPAGKAHVVITGGQLGAGREGRFTVETSAEVSSPTAPVRTLTARTVLGAHMDTARSFSKVSVSSEARAAGPQLPDGAELDILATASRAANGEDYTVVLRTPAKTLADIRATFPQAATRLDGTWKFDVGDGDVEPFAFALGRPLPTFSLRGDGSFAFEQSLTEVQAAGRLDATLENLRVIHPTLRVVGGLRLAADFDVVQRGDITRITRLQAQVTGKEPVASLQALQGFEFNTVTGELRVANPDADLLHVKLEGVPTAWARPFLPGYEIEGDALRGEFTAGARDGGFTLQPKQPLTLSRLSVSQDGLPLVRALDVAVQLSADYTPRGWQAQVGELILRSDNATLFTFQAKTGQQAGPDKPLIATGRYEADLAALLAQPIAQSYATLSRGRASGEFTASLNEKQEFATKLTVSDLTSVSNEALPKLIVDARVDVLPDGRIDARVPLVVDQKGRVSDLLLAAKAAPAGESLALDAQLTSDVLYVEDLQRLATPLGPPAQAPQPPQKPQKPKAPQPQPSPESKPAPPADKPVWAGITGQLALNLKKVVYSPTFTASDIAGTVKIGPAAMTLENVRAVLGDGGGLKVDGGLDFDAQKPAQPYALRADVALTNVDPGPIFRSLDPAKPAPVEGRFDLTTRVTGQAADPAGLAEAALGDVKLTSREGTLRALSVKVNAAAENTSKLAAVAGIIGSIAGSGTTVKYADRVRAAADVSKQLGAIQFDQLNVVLERDAQNNFAIKDLTLISPLVRMVGTGQITYQPGVPVWRQPLLVNLQLGAREQLAENLRTLKLLGESSDPLGYAPLIEQLRLDGSVQSIGVSQLQNLLNRALTN